MGLDAALRWGIDHEESRAAAAAVSGIHLRTRRAEGTAIIGPPAHAAGKGVGVAYAADVRGGAIVTRMGRDRSRARSSGRLAAR